MVCVLTNQIIVLMGEAECGYPGLSRSVRYKISVTQQPPEFRM